MDEKVSRGDKIVADGWAGANKPPPRPFHAQTYHNLNRNTLNRKWFHNF